MNGKAISETLIIISLIIIFSVFIYCCTIIPAPFGIIIAGVEILVIGITIYLISDCT